MHVCMSVIFTFVCMLTHMPVIVYTFALLQLSLSVHVMTIISACYFDSRVVFIVFIVFIATYF